MSRPGSATDSAATPDDDQFHLPTTDDPWWNETCWFTLMVPERNLYCYVYPWVRANQGILGGGVMVWDDRGRHPWDALHWNYQWTYPYPELGDLRDVTFPTGISIQCLEPMSKYRVAYEHPDCSLDMTFEAVLPPHVLGQDDDQSGTFAGHIDQPGHVTGHLLIGRERLEVDCYGIRDRSWGRRVPTPGLHMGYDIAIEARSALIVFSQPGQSAKSESEGPIVGGFGCLWRDGEQAPLASGTRLLERDGVWPKRVVVHAVDERGRSVDAIGECVNWIGFQNLPSMMNLVSLVRWEYEGSDGAIVEAWGEMEDVWDIDRYRRFAREI